MTVKTQRKSRTPSSTTVATSRRPRTTRARHLALLVEFADAELTATATARWAKELPAIRWSSAPEVLSTGPTRATSHAQPSVRCSARSRRISMASSRRQTSTRVCWCRRWVRIVRSYK